MESGILGNLDVPFGGRLSGDPTGRSLPIPLSGANIQRALFRRATIENTNLIGIRGGHNVHSLDSVIIVEQDELLFNLWERAWPETKVNWEIIRTAGRLPLFAASYSAIILIPIFFYGLALYNKSIEGALKWANPIVTNPTHEMQSLANFLEFTLHPQPLPSLSLVLLVSTLLLAVASTLFTFRCPSRIKEFSRDQWCDQLGKSLIHYWPLAWQERWIRLICAACYLIGGFGAVYVIGTKVLKVAWFIIENS